MKRSIKILFVAILCLAILAALLYTLKYATKDTQEPNVPPATTQTSVTQTQNTNPGYVSHERHMVSTTTDPVLFPTRVVIASDNFQLMREKGWESIPTTSLTLPEEMKNARFAFRRGGSECVLSYVSLKNTNGYKQTSFYDDRIFPNIGSQFDGSWYLHAKYRADDFAFRWDGKQPLPHEVLIIYFNVFKYPDADLTGDFILFDRTGGIVDESCSREASAMLATVSEYTETANVGPSSSGYLFLSGYGHPARLLYIEEKDSVVQETVKFNIDLNSAPVIYHNLIYFVQDSTLKTLDVFNKKITALSGFKTADGGTVNDYKISDNKIFYLSGKQGCNDYRAHCRLTLFEYDISSQTTKMLGENVPDRHIQGYEPSNGTLYLDWSDGDAGCSWVHSDIFSLSLGTTTVARDDSYCSDYADTGNAQADDAKSAAAVKSFFAHSWPQSTTTDYVILDSGSIQAPLDKITLPGPRQMLLYQN